MAQNDPAVPADDQFTVYTYDELLATQAETLDEVSGSDLTDKEALIGVPFVITRVVFRAGDYQDTEYVSVEATARSLGQVVFNDGSTGIRRQLLSYLLSKGIARVSSGDELPASSEAGDLPCGQLEWNAPAEEKGGTGADGLPRLSYVIPVKLHAPRGLRVSNYTYTDEGGKQRPASTYYLG